jgi:hypothetical protein
MYVTATDKGNRYPPAQGLLAKRHTLSMSLSGQEGIDRLLKAETEATEIVSKARKGKYRIMIS